MTLDFCRDLLDKVEEVGMDYLLLAINPAANGEYTLNSFSRFKPEQKQVFIQALETKLKLLKQND